MLSKDKVDPILVSVIANRLDTVAEQIAQTMLRTSRSPIFSEARDFVTAIFDRQLRLVAQRPYIAILLGATPSAVGAVADYYNNEIHPGDVFLVNDPYKGKNNHPPDFTVVKPVFYNGELIFWAVAKGHQADTGGTGAAGYNPTAQTVWEEGIRIPPVKLHDRGIYQRGIWDLILANVRLDFLVDGDLNCLVGAVTVGERRLLELVEKYGVDTIEQGIDIILDGSEKQVGSEIARIPNGIYYAERYCDHDGFNKDKLVAFRLKLVVEDDSVTFDYSDSDPQVRGGINSTYANTVSASYLALFTTIDPNISHNEGAFRPVKVIAPEGTVANCQEPAACTSCTICAAAALIEAGWWALAQAIPKLVQAAWARWTAPASMGFNPRTGRFFGEIHFLCKGGAGATYGFDGWDHLGVVVCSGGLRAPDPELHELVDPYTLLSYEYLPDSAGPGKWRGGMGTKYIFRVEADNILSDNFGDGLLPETAPFGLEGGKGAKPSKLVLRRVEGTDEDPEVHKFVVLNKGDIYEVWETGGGGYGDPLERPVQNVWADVRDELVSIESARADYGVVIDPATLQVDYAATNLLRESKKK